MVLEQRFTSKKVYTVSDITWVLETLSSFVGKRLKASPGNMLKMRLRTGL